MPVPQNAQALFTFLTGIGLSANAAAGVLGNIEQESGGNVESKGDGGGGLIGFTPLPSGYVTGNTSADLQTQEKAIQAWINNHGGLQALNAASTSPTAAATYFMNQDERPAAATANLANRIASAVAVAAAAASGNWPTGSGGGGGGGGGIDDLVNAITGPFQDLDGILKAFIWFFKPENWVRIVAGLFGAVALFIGGTALYQAAK
jgi:hypothetical protein